MTVSAVAAAPGNELIVYLFACAFLVATFYAAGRIHQFYRQSIDRDHAFRDGYNMATRSLFALATRTHKAVAAPPVEAPPMRGAASVQHRPVPSPGRPKHRAGDRRRADLAKTARITYGDDQRAS